jgi:hypothetical protein
MAADSRLEQFAYERIAGSILMSQAHSASEFVGGVALNTKGDL